MARVLGASDDADPAPLNALTQARGLTKVESMARDLIATILDIDEDTFDVEIDYVLPADLGGLLHEAKAARAWLDAAAQLWHTRSSMTARALADSGYSLREAAKLLGLSHQRVDQLLSDDSGVKRAAVCAMEFSHRQLSVPGLPEALAGPMADVDVLVLIHSWLRPRPELAAGGEDPFATLRARFEELLAGTTPTASPGAA